MPGVLPLMDRLGITTVADLAADWLAMGACTNLPD